MAYDGTLQRLILSRTLWLVVAWPIAALLWQLLIVRPRAARAKGPDAVLRARAFARVSGLGGVALTVTAVVGHAWVLLRLQGGSRALFEPVVRGARFERLDAGVDLLLDVRALVACGLACLVSLAAAIVLATRPPVARDWRAWAWIQLALAGALTSFLADGLVTVAMGWALAGAAGAWLAGWRHPGAGVTVATRIALAIAALVGAASLLFWGLGGSWDDGGYAPDLQPRLVAVEAGSTGGETTLSAAEPVGARVFVDESRGSPLRVPFARAPLAPGSHSFRVRTGDGEDDVAVAAVEVQAGESIAIVPLGPILSFHAMADELGLHGRIGRSTLRRSIEERTGPGGLALVPTVVLALLLAAWAASAWSPAAGAPPVASAVAAGASTTAVGPFLLMRVDFLSPSAPRTAVVVASVGGAILLAALWRSLRFVGTPRWTTFASAAPPGLALLALGLGGTVPALGVMAGAGVAAAATHLTVALRGDAADVPVAVAEESWTLVGAPEQIGELLVSMERWVVGALASAMAACAVAAAWVVAGVDRQILASPSDRLADEVARGARAVEPLVGAPLGRVVWALLAAAAAVALLHAVWRGS